MRNTLAVLSEISARLPDHLPGFTDPVLPKDMLLSGNATKCLMMSEPEISVYRWVMGAGTVFTTHCHPGHELMIISHGGMALSIDADLGSRFEKNEKGEYLVSAGSMVTIAAGTKHGAVFPVESTLLTIHIPRSEEYESWPNQSKPATSENIDDCLSANSRGSTES